MTSHTETTQYFESTSLEQMTSKNNEMNPCGESSTRDDMLAKEVTYNMNSDEKQLLERGLMQYGCPHYRRRCHIRAPCCNEVFDCRHCHNEAKNNIDVEKKHWHDIPRHEVHQVICSLCGTEQEVHQNCINCGVCMGKYFCKVCKLFDDDVSGLMPTWICTVILSPRNTIFIQRRRKGYNAMGCPCTVNFFGRLHQFYHWDICPFSFVLQQISKRQYHCDGCGICRIGGRENFFHCYKCGCCYSILLKDCHPCVEGAMHHDCPICFEFLFESRNDITVLPCGHTIHTNCLKEMQEHFQFACPLCSKSVCDMSKVWEKFDAEIAATPMPEPYQNKMVWILCNDCGKTSNVQFHVVAHKCPSCKSYNTRKTRD